MFLRKERLFYGLFIAVFLLSIAMTVLAQDGNSISETGQEIQGIAGEFWERIEFATQNSTMQLALIIGGAVLILIGWRVYNFVILIAGTLSGALLALALVNSSNILLSVIAMLIGAIIGGILATFLYYVAIFAIGAYVGAILTFQIVTALSLTVDSLLAMIFGGIMGGIILIGLSFELLVIISSIVGGQLLSLGLGLDSWWTIGFIAFGIIWQITLAKVTGYKIRRRPTKRMLFRDA